MSTNWDKTLPTNGDPMSDQDDDIRLMFAALEDALGRCLNFPGNEGSDAGEGEVLILREQTSHPTEIANAFIMYMYGNELWGKDEDGNQIKFTDAGDLNVTETADINSGDKMWFYLDSAPTGWTIDSGVSDKIVGVKGGATYTTGASTAGTWTQPDHTLTADECPSHTHTVVKLTAIDRWRSSGSYLDSDGTGALGSDETTSVGSGNAHNHGSTYRPLAHVGIIASKD